MPGGKRNEMRTWMVLETDFPRKIKMKEWQPSSYSKHKPLQQKIFRDLCHPSQNPSVLPKLASE
jgi:hypothetical protein